MKKTRTIIAALMFVAASLGTAWAIPMATVGGPDTLKYWTTLSNSGAETETNWVKSVLGTNDVTLEFKNEGNFAWNEVDGTDYYAQLLDGMPAYFLVKAGNGSALGTHFLYENLASLSYAVINMAEAGFEIDQIGKVSHITEFNNAPPVPEPGTLLLLGSGLAGLAWYSRKRKQG